VAKKSKDFSILDRNQTIEGKFSCKGKLIINGTVKGTFDGEDVVIGEGGAIYADAEMESLVIAGRFEGNLKVTKELSILSTGVCIGKVESMDLVVELGGILNAEITSLKMRELEPKPGVPLVESDNANKKK